MDFSASGRQAILLVVALALTHGATADEGLWTYDRVPRELIAARRGVPLTDAWLTRVQLASVRLSGGCSAAFVSPHGLMITSRPCVDSCLAENTTAGANLTVDGFVSRNGAAEKRCRRMRAQVLISTEDVTGQVMLATAGIDALAAANARDRELARLERQCEEAALGDRKAEQLDCEPVALFGGGEYRLYKYRPYDDVRLAFAPERSVTRSEDADPDFPRQGFDVALLRVYVDGKPAATDQYLQVNFAGPAERESLYVSGNPAATQRSTTVAELLTARDTVLAGAGLDAAELKGRYVQFALSGAQARDHIALPLARLTHELRVASAAFEALLDEQQLGVKRAEEESLKLRIAQDPDFKLTAASAFDEIASAQQAWRNLGSRRMLLDDGLGVSGAGAPCHLCNYARLLVRAAAERQKPDAERLPGFRARELPRAARELASTEPVAVDVDILNLGFVLERLRVRLGPNDPLVAKLFASEPPATLAERAISRTRLIDPRFRQQLWSAGAGAIVLSDDPLIALTRDIESAAAGVALTWRQTVDAPERRANERLARARMRLGDASSYADATDTLRLSSGTMVGWTVAGAPVAPMTTIAQLFERATQPASQLPAAWTDARGRINGAAGLSIAIDNDIGAGCPGCAVVSAAGELVGVVVDGNRRAAAGRYWFDAAAGRAIALDTAALKEILLKVYRTDELMKEIVVGE
jgi:hypothetical protein